ncbi:hypothetical protein CEP54_009813 [Fusarium duplospermum]|uniref:Uncharacterized protein n=1 Tax=Fusarium duplospermum TaxID=1325734 RepID=A0A428PNE7_9HYPO|nr:hypothetical protein CEP54_009813 [Fusarium duplospermum]
MALVISPSSRKGQRNEIHLSVRTHCDACGFYLLVGEPFLCLECPATSQPRVYGLFRLPLHCPLGQTFHSLRLCRQPFCDACNKAPDVATLHTECFNVFMQKCTATDKLERLACFTTWREPWHAAPSLGLRPRLNIKKAMNLAADLCGMQRLCSLPLEIAEMIQHLSESAVFWRYASVMELVERASAIGDEKHSLTSYDISKIDLWERGAFPILTRDTALSEPNAVIRIKIDSSGISSIERLPETPSPSNSRSDSVAYIVETEHSLRNMTVNFKFGLCRLVPVPGVNLLHIWDKPCPQRPPDCVLYSSSALSKQSWFRQLKTIDPRDCTGVTFFLGSETWAIHAHSSLEPTAESTFHKLSQERQHNVVWVYVPLPATDRVEAFGIQNEWSNTGAPRQGACYLLRTALCGDVTIGSYQRGETTVLSRATAYGLALVHDVPEFSPISFLGVTSNSKDQVEFTPKTPVSSLPPFRRPFFSSARLSGVTRVEIFRDPHTGFCRGILLTYGNGSQRALGQCRIGIDGSTVCTLPTWICIANFQHSPPKRGFRLQGVQWECFPMKGWLEFWFRRQESQVYHIWGD